MYSHVIQEQLAEGVIERVTEEEILVNENSTYHTRQLFVIMLKVQACGLYMMYQPGKTVEVLSLNDCLETSPALQNFLWSVLIRRRFNPIALCGDL